MMLIKSFVEGEICTGAVFVAGSAEDVNVDLNETFYIVPGTSTGAVAGSSGGGTLQIADDVQIVSSSIVKNAGYVAIGGAFQLHP